MFAAGKDGAVFGALGGTVLGGLGGLLGDTTLGVTLSYLSFSEHYDRLIRGLLDTKDIVYYLSGTGLMLFIAHRIVDSHRWQ